MIIWQLTLSAAQLRTLVALRHKRFPERGSPDSFISSVRALMREGLVTHHPERLTPKLTGGPFPYDVTKKGRLALQLAAVDVGDFLREISNEDKPQLPAGYDIRESLQAARTATKKKPPA